MFFKREKIEDNAIGLTPGVEERVASFIQHGRDVADGKHPAPIFTDAAPLQLLTDADVAYFVAAMEAEAARIDDEADQLSRKRLADIAAKDAQIAAINREIEKTKAKLEAQDAEIGRRVADRVDLLGKVAKIDPNLATDNLTEDQIRAAVVRSKYGAQAVDGRPQSYIDARFDFLVDSLSVDPFREVAKDGLVQALDAKAAAEKAYLEYVDYLKTAYKKTH